MMAKAIPRGSFWVSAGTWWGQGETHKALGKVGGWLHFTNCSERHPQLDTSGWAPASGSSFPFVCFPLQWQAAFLGVAEGGERDQSCWGSDGLRRGKGTAFLPKGSQGAESFRPGFDMKKLIFCLGSILIERWHTKILAPSILVTLWSALEVKRCAICNQVFSSIVNRLSLGLQCRRREIFKKSSWLCHKWVITGMCFEGELRYSTHS